MLFWTIGRVTWIAVDLGADKAPQDHDLVQKTTLPAPPSTTRDDASPLPRRTAPATSSGRTRPNHSTMPPAINASPSTRLLHTARIAASDRPRHPVAPAILATDYFLPPPADAGGDTVRVRRSADAGDWSPPSNPPTRPAAGTRWSGYFWLFTRQNAPARNPARSPILRSPDGRHGASQAGAILSYRFAGRPDHHISGYTRLSTTLAAPAEQELALGFKAKPIDRLPVTIYAEQRLAPERQADRGRAIFIAGGMNPTRLPLPILTGTTIETYGQAGYVFHRNQTFIFDGLASIQQPVITRGERALSVGAGFWAGGDKTSHRIDIGPRAEFRIPIRKAPIRIAIDWRQRIGGQAAPGSGVAATVSTGF